MDIQDYFNVLGDYHINSERILFCGVDDIGWCIESGDRNETLSPESGTLIFLIAQDRFFCVK